MGDDWRHCAGLALQYFEADGDGWFMPRMVFQLFNSRESLKDGIGPPKQKPSGILRAMAFDEVCPEQLLDAPFDWEEPQLEGSDPRLIAPGVHGRLATPVMDPRTLRDVQAMSVAPRWDGSGTTAIKWFLDLRAWERDGMYRLTDAMRRAVLLSLIPASRSNPLQEMENRYRFRYQDLLREVTEEVFTEANDDVILEAFHTVKQSSLTPTPRAFIYFVEQFLALGRRVCDRNTQWQAKDRLLDVIATMKLDRLLKEIIKEETKVGLGIQLPRDDGVLDEPPHVSPQIDDQEGAHHATTLACHPRIAAAQAMDPAEPGERSTNGEQGWIRPGERHGRSRGRGQNRGS